MATVQTPIQSGFGATTTASDVLRGIDLRGKTALVTGGRVMPYAIDSDAARRLWELSEKFIG
jgi:hypothetical protein